MINVIIGGPVRNRGWIIQEHIDAVKAMEIPEGVQVEYLYLVNDSTDDTAAILDRNGIKHGVIETKHQSGSVRGEYSYANLATLRNMYMDLAIANGADYVLSIDSDILPPVDALKQLLRDNCDIVSMLLSNQPLPIEQRRAHNVMQNDWNNIMQHIYDFPMDELFSVDLTGACYLVKKEVIQAGCQYADDIQGEDIPFCRQAKAKGFGIFCDSRVRAIHCMYPGQYIEAGRII